MQVRNTPGKYICSVYVVSQPEIDSRVFITMNCEMTILVFANYKSPFGTRTELLQFSK